MTKRFFAQGEQISGVNYFFTRDHLGSIREMVDGSGSIRARYDYDPYGRRSKLSGDLEADFGFTGHYFHAASGLWLTLFRAYDPDSGRWLSRDPLAEGGGLNLYAYAANNPINAFDPLGLSIYGNMVRISWSLSLAVLGAFAGGAIGGTGGLAFGPAAVITSPVGAIAGAIAGATAGAIAGYEIGDNIAKAYGLDDCTQNMSKSKDSPDGGGNLKVVSNNQLADDGIDPHAVKADFVGPDNVSKFNIAVDSNNNVVLTPRIVGSGGNVATGLNYSDLADFYPLR